MIASYKLFMTPMCPNCSEIHEYLETTTLKGGEVDASTEEGLEQAQQYGVMGVPTMVFLDKKGTEINRATTIAEIKRIISNRSLLEL
jgi:thioredoxin-related protein